LKYHLGRKEGEKNPRHIFFLRKENFGQFDFSGTKKSPLSQIREFSKSFWSKSKEKWAFIWISQIFIWISPRSLFYTVLIYRDLSKMPHAVNLICVPNLF
jgi:hypothetical protein